MHLRDHVLQLLGGSGLATVAGMIAPAATLANDPTVRAVLTALVGALGAFIVAGIQWASRRYFPAPPPVIAAPIAPTVVCPHCGRPPATPPKGVEVVP